MTSGTSACVDFCCDEVPPGGFDQSICAHGLSYPGAQMYVLRLFPVHTVVQVSDDDADGVGGGRGDSGAAGGHGGAEGGLMGKGGPGEGYGGVKCWLAQ